MRILTLLALLLFAPHPFAVAADDDFTGAWTASLCPGGAQQDLGQCSNFVLELIQNGDKLCGAHVYATPGAARIDEGAAPSVTGDIAEDTATATVVSSRTSPPTRVRVELKLYKGQLQWKRLENPKGDYLLPLTAQLTRSKRKTLMAPLFEHELKAACTMLFTAEAERARQAETERALQAEADRARQELQSRSAPQPQLQIQPPQPANTPR